MDIDRVIERSAEQLAQQSHELLEKRGHALPSVDILGEVVELLSEVIFPGYWGRSSVAGGLRKNHIAINLERIATMLGDQIERALNFKACEVESTSGEIVEQFIDSIIDIHSDVEAMYRADPAATSGGEVAQRCAHRLYRLIIPRIIAEMAHSKTGIDIHPRLRLGAILPSITARVLL